MDKKRIIDEIASPSVKKRIDAVNSLMRSLNHPESEINRKWMNGSKPRLAKIRFDDVYFILSHDFFENHEPFF